MKALVTGAGGQLGRTLVRALAPACDVTPLIRTELDLTDDARVRAVVAAARPGVILNCAAYNDVDGAEDDPVTALAVNAFGVRSLARAAAGIDATLVHYGTDFVFDGTAAEPYVETDAPNPQSVYATSKLLGEWFAGAARHYVLRVESLFGEDALAPAAAGRRWGSSLDRMADARSSTVSSRPASSTTWPPPPPRCCGPRRRPASTIASGRVTPPGSTWRRSWRGSSA